MRSIKLPSWSRRILGFGAVPVAPHVFSLTAGGLSYGCFERGEKGFEFRDYHRAELGDDLFHPGPMGGTVRDAAALREAVGSLLEEVADDVVDASLVLPDTWYRVAFTPVGALPRSAKARDDILRWKLRQLVPFRVEELRLAADEVTPLADQTEPRRLALGFAIDLLLRQLEDAFAAHGVRLGHISNASLSLLASLSGALGGVDLALVVLVEDSHYSLVFSQRGLPAMHRLKLVGGGLSEAGRETTVMRDLALTKSFVRTQLQQRAIGKIVLVSDAVVEGTWRGWLERAFDCPAVALRDEWPFLGDRDASAPVTMLAPMFGAACREVA